MELPSLEQIAGRHRNLYEAYFHQIALAIGNQTVHDGLTIPAMEAAKFLKRSGLTDAILSRIWDLSDYSSKGVLDKIGFFLALRFITHAQNGLKLDIGAIGGGDDIPEPIIAGGPPPPLPSQVDPNAAKKQMWRAKFQQLSMGSGTGRIPGGIAKQFMMESKLPIDRLGQIWDMSDVDKDGELSESEFYNCIELIEKAHQAIQVSQAPPQAPPPASMPASVPPPIVPPPPGPSPIRRPSISTGEGPQPVVSAAQMATTTNNFFVTPEMHVRYESMFKMADQDKDGYVSGMEIKDLFLQSGLNQTTLAGIWNLADTSKSGKLTFEEFTVSMWFIEAVLRESKNPASNFQLPATLDEYPAMVEYISKKMIGVGTIGSSRKGSIVIELPSEFQLIAKEIQELEEEKQKWSYEILARESEKAQKNGELSSLSSELDNLTATLKQLENQKNLASVKLGDLEAQVLNLRGQHSTQDEALTKTENENKEKANELSNLELEQIQIETELVRICKENENLNEKQTNYNLNFNHFKARHMDLELLRDSMRELIEKFGKCIEKEDYYTLAETDLRDLGFELDEFEIEFEKFNRGFSAANAEAEAHDGAFGGGQQQQQHTPQIHEDFSSNDNSHWAGNEGQGQGGSWDTGFTQADPFAPKSPGQPPKSPMMAGSAGDAFGHEPFASPSPTDSGMSPTPAADKPPVPLPPKKMPPGRPAPPKAAPGRPPPPKKAPTPTPSGTGTGSGPTSETADDNFANFADFANFEDQSSKQFTSNSGGKWKLNLKKNSNNKNGRLPELPELHSKSSTTSRGRPVKKSNDNQRGGFTTSFSSAFNSSSSSTMPSNFATNFNSTSSNSKNNNNNFNSNFPIDPFESLNSYGSVKPKSSSGGSGASANKFVVEDFQEDPFKNYRYADVDDIFNPTQQNQNNEPFNNNNNNNNFFFDANDPFK